jgi:CRISPR/Cas system-associated exonuclease Cas4 (RecB family)
MIGLSRRSGQYIHPSWMAKALAGERQCHLSLYVQANYKFPKKSDFDAETYRLNHQALLGQYSAELRQDSFIVHTERANSFEIIAGSAVISGTPDIVALNDEGPIVVDIKTGQARANDIAQVKLYMMFLPLVKLHGIEAAPLGRLVYANGEVFDIEPESLTETFRDEVRQLVRMMRGAEVPPSMPSAQECRFCPLKHLCADAVDQVAQVTVDWL